MAAEAESSAMVRIKWIQLLRSSGVFYAGDELWCPSPRGSGSADLARVFPGEVGVAASATSPREFVPLASSSPQYCFLQCYCGASEDCSGASRCFSCSAAQDAVVLERVQWKKVSDVKKLIETSQGHPADQQMLVHQGAVLKDGTTLEENKVLENNFLVMMLRQNKGSSSAAPAKSKEPSNQAPPTQTVPANPASQAPATPAPQAAAAPAPIVPASAPAPAATASPAPAVAVSIEAETYGQAASNLVAGGNLEATIQSILEMGGGTWDRDTVLRALRAAFNNPERAVEYLYAGIPEQMEIPAPPPSAQPADPAQAPQATQAAVASSGPNASPLDLFPQALPNASANAAGEGNLDVLRNNAQFRSLLSLVQANPQILQPLLQELGKQNPQILQLIQDNQAEFLRLINEPAEGDEDENLLDQFAEGVPQTIAVTPEENEAILRLEGMGFDRALVLEVYFACNKDETLAANYLLDHINEFDDGAP